MSFQRLVLQILASTPSFQSSVLWLRLASTDFIPAFGTSDTREYPVISAFATPATREYSVISAFDTLATTREYLSHFSVWYFRYSRVHRRFSVWYSGYDSRVLISFKRTSDAREYTVVSAFGSPGTRKYSVNSDLGTSGTREYSVSSAFRAPSTREYSVVSVLVLQLLKSILSHFRSSHSRYSRVLSHFSFW